MCGGLLQLGFDGWGEDFNQFVEWRSADIYPIAWCELVRHPLQAPKENGHVHQTGPDSKKRCETRFPEWFLTEYINSNFNYDSSPHFMFSCSIKILLSLRATDHYITKNI